MSSGIPLQTHPSLGPHLSLGPPETRSDYPRGNRASQEQGTHPGPTPLRWKPATEGLCGLRTPALPRLPPGCPAGHSSVQSQASPDKDVTRP